MNDLDDLTDRLHDLGRRAPVPAADPLLDVRRGRTALRRRHARSAAGVTTALVAVGVTASSLPGLGWSRGSDEKVLQPAADSSTTTAPAPSSAPSSATTDPCIVTEAEFRPVVSGPEVDAAQRAYGQAAAAILDPSGQHIDLSQPYNEITGSGSFRCDPTTGDLSLGNVGARIGWASGDALGMIVISVALTEEVEEPEDNGGRWSAYDGVLPDGVVRARTADFSTNGGHSVIVERTDGLTVIVVANGAWPREVPSGAVPATELPGIGKLLELAASPQVTFPGS